MVASCLVARAGRSTFTARQPLWRSVPPEGGVAGTLPMNFTTLGSFEGAWANVPLYPIDHRGESDITAHGLTALVVEFADGSADLIVGVIANVFHQKVDQARIALENAEKLEGAVRRRTRGGSGGRRLNGRGGGDG